MELVSLQQEEAFFLCEHRGKAMRGLNGKGMSAGQEESPHQKAGLPAP